MERLLLAVLPLVGVVLGALLQYYLGHLKGERERADQRRNDAYSDYLRSVSAIANTQMGENREGDFKLRSALADAKCRISIYGTDEVVSRLSAFEATGANLADEKSLTAFLSLAHSMRRDAGNGSSKPSQNELKLILFGRG